MRKTMNHLVLQETSLRHFLEVVRTGSVTEAAESLGVAPSAVSRHVAHLEAELDTLLFERRARGMVANAAGELLATHARRAWQDIERVADEIHALRGLKSGAVLLASTEGFASEFIPGLIAEFQRQYTGIRFELQVRLQAEVPELVRQGKIDIGVTVSSVSERGISVEVRHPSPIIAVLSRDHPLARRRQLALAQLVGHTLALPGKDSTVRQLFDISCSRQGLVFDSIFECNRLEPCIAYAAAQGGIGFSGELALRNRLQRGDVIGVPLRDREMTERHFEVQTLAGRNLPRAAKAFLEHLREALSRAE
ncbi:MAG TPA: LysR family transcriptional regulator [Burkholderiaceae bacterium]|nr:LysR family transcriptional regulator [Burkholderiaceae bacterium]